MHAHPSSLRQSTNPYCFRWKGLQGQSLKKQINKQKKILKQNTGVNVNEKNILVKETVYVSGDCFCPRKTRGPYLKRFDLLF